MVDGSGAISADFLRIYGAFGYSLSVALAITWASIGIAYMRARREYRLWLFLTISMFLFAGLFAYLTLISAEFPWLRRETMQPIMRSVGLLAALTGWIFTIAVLRREAKV
jgi:hypothetical protein